MKNSDVLYLTSRSIEQLQQEHKQNHLKKLRNLKESKLNKIYSVLKLEAFKTKAKFFPLKIPISKIFSKSIFVSEMGPVLYLQNLKNIHWSLKIDD